MADALDQIANLNAQEFDILETSSLLENEP
jgi:hypothetical protein